ncbi:hypothetical protein DCC85_12255 [Paenibacillus sp. CAA11]|nr:hypothetical protein DCC85_12255 [Paenibacillus sp. CAA11]
MEPIKRDPAFKARLKREIEHIETLLEEGQGAEEEIQAFNELTGRTYDAYIFSHYWSAISLEDLIEEACQGEPTRIPDITREELVEIARRLQDEELSHGDTKFYMQLLEANVPMPEVSDLIYWEDLEPEQIIERAMAYESIRLPGPEPERFGPWIDEMKSTMANSLFRGIPIGQSYSEFVQATTPGLQALKQLDDDHYDYGGFQIELCDEVIYAITVPAEVEVTIEQIETSMGSGEVHATEEYCFLTYYSEQVIANFKFNASNQRLIEVRLITTMFMD